MPGRRITNTTPRAQKKREHMRRVRAERREEGYRYYKPTPAPVRALAQAIQNWSKS